MRITSLVQNDPLVSIVVITYNSAEYVLETLDSILTQCYRNIELIITDDFSSDNTLQLCSGWITKNKSRFANVEIISAPINLGIPANCNRGVKVTNGEWIKIVAGDDILSPNSVSKVIKNVDDHVNLIVGKFQTFSMKNSVKTFLNVLPTESQLKFFSLEPKEQCKQLMVNSFNFTPGVYIRKTIFENHGYFNEDYRFIEDLPFWIHLTSRGEKFVFLDELVFNYRVFHSSMVFTTETFYNQRFKDCLYRFRREVIYKLIPKTDIIFYQAEIIEMANYWMIINVFKNRRNWLSKIASKGLLFFTFKKLINIFAK